MVTALAVHDLGAPGGAATEFDRGFHGLGARVGKVYPLQPVGEGRQQPLGQ